MNLQYLRDRQGREIDFVILKDKKPLFAVECKVSDQNLSKAIKYFKERTQIPKFYQVHLGKKDFGSPEVEGRVSFLEVLLNQKYALKLRLNNLKNQKALFYSDPFHCSCKPIKAL